MDAKAKVKLQWFQILNSLYEMAAPHIDACTGLQCRAIEERAVDCDAVNQNARMLRQLLSIVKNMPAPRSEELINSTKKHFETALSSCINASEALVNYMQVDDCHRESQLHLDRLINSIVLAREYSESTHKRLDAYRE
jgi:hypothetical protein